MEINGNIPSFSDEKSEGPAYEFYSELDSLGRCGYAESKIIPGLMPDEERGAIGMVKPTGWHTVKYENVESLPSYRVSADWRECKQEKSYHRNQISQCDGNASF